MSAHCRPQPPSFEQILYDEPRPKVARITLNRPESRNAQGPGMLYELNAAFDFAAQDDDIHVIVLAAAGPDFSSGHDLSGKEDRRAQDFPPVSPWGQFKAPGAEGAYNTEKEIYLEMCERWRNLPKPTIAQVQGRCIAGGVMLVWPCDLIVAGEDARFLDNTPDMGIPGVEFFSHAYEMGVRKAKEWLFTTEWLTAREALQLGMVNRVVANDRLEEETLNLASRIAGKHLITLKAIKELVNGAQDLQGRRQNHLHAFALHHLAHSHFRLTQGFPIAIDRLPEKIQAGLKAVKGAIGKSKTAV